MQVIFTLANKITIVRILSIPFFISVILYYSPQKDYLRFVALGIFLFATISDFIDGYIARTRNQRTAVGSLLDPLADKILLISAFICLYMVGVSFNMIRFPIWLVVAVISRDVILVVGTMVGFLILKEVKIEPTFLGKATTFFQVICVICVLLQWSELTWLWNATLALIIITVLDYIVKGVRLLNSSNSAPV